MSYHPSQVNRFAGAEIPSGIVYFGHSPTGRVYEADSNFTIDGTYLNAAKIKLPVNGTIGISNYTDAITIGANGDISLRGNLTVNGTTTTVNSTTLTVEDPIIILGSGAPTTDDNKDRGISFNYFDGAAKTGFFGFDDSAGKFTFIPQATISGEIVSGNSGIIVANLEGNADTSTKWANSINLQLTDQVTGSGDFDGSANVSFDVQLTADAINDQIETTVANDTDYLIITSGTSLRKIAKSNFVSDLGGGTMSSFVVHDGDGTQVTIDNAKEIKFIGASGVTINWTDTDTGSNADPYDLTFTVDHNQTFNYNSNEHINHTGVSIIAGSGLVGGGDITTSRTLDIVGGDGITVSADEIEVTVDNTTIELSASDGNGSIRVKDAGITEIKRSRTIETITSSKLLDKDVTLINATSSSITGYLPENATAGRVMIVKRIDGNADSGPYDVIIAASGSDTIDGSTLFQLYYKYETLTFISNGSEWYII
jgi:hypothetical protein